MMLNVTGLMKLYNVGVGFLEKEREKKRGVQGHSSDTNYTSRVSRVSRRTKLVLECYQLSFEF